MGPNFILLVFYIQSVNMLSTGLQMLSKLPFKASFKKYER